MSEQSLRWEGFDLGSGGHPLPLTEGAAEEMLFYAVTQNKWILSR